MRDVANDLELDHRELIDRLPRAVLVTADDGTIRLWNRRAEELFGWAEHEVLGRPLAEILDGVAKTDDTVDAYRTVAGDVNDTSDRVVWRRDGSSVRVFVTVQPLLDAAGRAEGMLLTAEDVAGRRGAERALRDRFEFLAKVNDALNASATVADILRNATRVAVPRLGDWCAIYYLAPEGNRAPQVVVAHDEATLAACIGAFGANLDDDQMPTSVSHVVRSGDAHLVTDIDDGHLDELGLDEDARTTVKALGLRSLMTVPIIKRGRTVGAMQLVLSDPTRRFDQDDLTLAQLAAARIAVSLENRRLGEHQRHIAETLQRSLLPTDLPTVPGVDVAVRYWAAGEGTEVGGDFYDVFSVGDARWGVIVGDVCGTGPAAAALTGMARHTIRTAAWHGDTEIEVLRALNEGVLRSGSLSFCTAAYATLRSIEADAGPPQWQLTVASGGHPLPVQIGLGGTRTVGRPGTLLGIYDKVNVSTETVDLHPGDVVVFYTDGATDVAPPHHLTAEAFAALVEDAVATSSGADAEAVADRIQAGLEAVLAFSERDDDIALLVLHLS